jgi:hypothetical protein
MTPLPRTLHFTILHLSKRVCRQEIKACFTLINVHLTDWQLKSLNAVQRSYSDSFLYSKKFWINYKKIKLYN